MSRSIANVPLKKTRQFNTLDELLNTWQNELDSASSMDEIKSKLQSFRHDVEWDVDYSGPFSKQTGHRQYDAIIESIFNAANSAIPKEQLLEQLLNYITNPKLKSQAICVMVIEAVLIDETEQHYQYIGLQQRQLNPQHWKNFNKNILPEYNASVLFRKILLEHLTMNVWHSDYIDDYDGEFDSIVGKTGKGGSPNKIKTHPFWISALPLPASSYYYPPRALIILYPAKSTDSVRYIPPGANQEWRCIQLFGIAYQHLEHRVRNAADIILKDRNTLLTSLAPGLLHHEIGHQIRAISDIIQLQRIVVKRLLEQRQTQDIQRLAYHIHLLETASSRLFEITNAFNNMEKQSIGESFALADVLADAQRLCFHRLGNSTVSLELPSDNQSIQLFSDPPLLLHLLINLMTNAIIAFEHDTETNYGEIGRRILINVESIVIASQQQLAIHVENNGPPILDLHRSRIFEKGFTTYKIGHGQGLYICQLIAQYLGGNLVLLHHDQLSEQMQVGFRITMLKDIPKREDLSRSR